METRHANLSFLQRTKANIIFFATLHENITMLLRKYFELRFTDPMLKHETILTPIELSFASTFLVIRYLSESSEDLSLLFPA
jgi:hypothetical protein